MAHSNVLHESQIRSFNLQKFTKNFPERDHPLCRLRVVLLGGKDKVCGKNTAVFLPSQLISYIDEVA